MAAVISKHAAKPTEGRVVMMAWHNGANSSEPHVAYLTVYRHQITPLSPLFVISCQRRKNTTNQRSDFSALLM
jgi:hypothetical protein